MLFAPSAATVLKYPDVGDDLTDYTRHLVTVVPKGADVRVTTAQPVADDAGDGSHFADHDLRRDILIHCHDNREHPSLAETSRDVRALIWFPKMQSYIDYHYNSCSYCVAKRTAADPVGTAIRVQRRLKMIEFDHKILEPDVVAATGCAAILTIVDVVARVTMYVPVHTLNTVDTARALYTRWYSLFGSPAVMRMDNAPAYTSAVMQAFHKLMGVRHVDLSAPDNPTHHAMVERRNQIMEKMLDVAISKGDLNSKADLDMYCASAASVCNLEHTSRFWIEKARRKRQKRCAFLIAKPYGPGLKIRLH